MNLFYTIYIEATPRKNNEPKINSFGSLFLIVMDQLIAQSL